MNAITWDSFEGLTLRWGGTLREERQAAGFELQMRRTMAGLLGVDVWIGLREVQPASPVIADFGEAFAGLLRGWAAYLDVTWGGCWYDHERFHQTPFEAWYGLAAIEEHARPRGYYWLNYLSPSCLHALGDLADLAARADGIYLEPADGAGTGALIGCRKAINQPDELQRCVCDETDARTRSPRGDLPDVLGASVVDLSRSRD